MNKRHEHLTKKGQLIASGLHPGKHNGSSGRPGVFGGEQIGREADAAAEHEWHLMLLASLGGALGVFIGLIGVVAVGLEGFANTPGIGLAMVGVSNPEAMSPGAWAAALAPCGAPCDHTDQAITLILWFTALSFGGGILAAIAAIVPRLGGVMMIAVAGGLLALAGLAYIHLTQSTAESLSGMGLFFSMGPPLIFLWGGYRTGVFSLLPHSHLKGLGNRMMARAKRSSGRP